jgi:hypothetical protein
MKKYNKILHRMRSIDAEFEVKEKKISSIFVFILLNFLDFTIH